MRHIWSKICFEAWITANGLNGICLYHFSNLITLMALLCSQWTPNVQMKYLMFDWSIYRIFVLNRDWKRDSLQMMVFFNVCSTWSMVELKTRFETWITRNDVNGVSLFNFTYLITLKAYLCSQREPNVQIKHFVFECSICRLFVLNMSWKLETLQIMIFVYICSTWGIVELNRVLKRE
jgi:hypothetical protein